MAASESAKIEGHSITEDIQGRKSCEVRLGLVLYGGVSLAIYINGVMREFFDAVRGRGAYKLIKVLTDSDVVVDVISGTSAGGINGILLAYALCNEREFGDSAALWRRDGGIRQLLRNPRGAAEKWDSVLDSEGYYQPALEAAFRYMGAYARETAEEPSALDELDLYVTGTDVDGTVWTQLDDAGHAIDVKEHRAAFLLKHRPKRPDLTGAAAGRKQPFNPRPPGLPAELANAYEATTYQALAKLARLTSCFPAAFAPVVVSDATDRVRTADARLREWGKLEKEACFLDGGVLDNKPFTYTLEAIFSRRADRRIERRLCYVEPDPEALHRRTEASRPNFFEAVVASLIGIPGYESISSDLRLIADHNSKLEQYKRIVSDCRDRILAVPEDDHGRDLTSDPLYVRSRLVDISERVVRSVLRKHGRDQVLSEDERRAAGKLITTFDEVMKEHPGPVLVAFDVLYRLRRAYHLVYFIYESLHGNGTRRVLSPPTVATYGRVWRAFNRQIELLGIIQRALEGLLDAYEFNWHRMEAKEIWAKVQELGLALVRHPYRALPEKYSDAEQAPGTWLSPATLSEFHAELAERIAQIVDPPPGASRGVDGEPRTEPPQGTALLSRTDAYERQIMSQLDPGDPVSLAYHRFEHIDAHVFPLELVAGLEQKDIIRTVRISPRDAEKGFSRRGFSDKVAGDALYHFGGFFKRSWRSNDILWGRLDGSCQLIETLLPGARLREIIENPELCARLRTRLNDPAMAPKNLFPRAGKKTQDDLKQWLDALVSDDLEERTRALETQFPHFQELIIEATQLEIIHGELPNVITDALEEQSEWSEVAVAFESSPGLPRAAEHPSPATRSTVRDGSSDAPPSGERGPETTDGRGRAGSGHETEVPGAWIFKPLDRKIDPFVAAVAAAERMRAAMREMGDQAHDAPRPVDTVLGRFFRQSYRVGTETLTRDIPPRVLLEILAVALLVVRNCVLATFGAHAERVRRNPGYRLGVALPLTGFYYFTRLLGGSTRRRATVLGGIFLLALVVLGASLWELAAQLMPQQLASDWQLPAPYPKLMLIGSIVGLSIVFAIARVLGRPRGFAPALSRTVRIREPEAPIDAHFRAECRMSGRRLDVHLAEGTLRLHTPAGEAVRIRRVRVALARHADGRRPDTYAPGVPYRLVATSAWRRARAVVAGGDATPMWGHRRTITLPDGFDRSQHWLVVQLMIHRRWWWPFGKGALNSVVVHSARFLEDRLAAGVKPSASGGDQRIERPASTRTGMPLANDDSAEARKRIA